MAGGSAGSRLCQQHTVGSAGAQGSVPARGAHGGQGHPPTPVALLSQQQLSSAPNTAVSHLTQTEMHLLWVFTSQLCILSFPPEAKQQNLGETDAPGRRAGCVESLHSFPLCSAALHSYSRSNQSKNATQTFPSSPRLVSGAEHEACKHSCSRQKCNFPTIS